ncbi:PAS domain-containing protein [Vibrio sp. PP-XX7]
MMRLVELPNNQGLMLFSRAASAFLTKRLTQQNSAIIKSFLIVMIFSSVFGAVIAINPSSMVSRLEKVSKERNTYMRLLDQYVPVFETDMNGVITRCNQAFCLLSRYDESDLVGKPASIFNYDQAKNNLSIYGILCILVYPGRRSPLYF